MTSRLSDAIARAESHLRELATVESVVADIRAGRQTDLTEIAGSLAESIESDQRSDGSWLGSLLQTSLMLLLIKELRPYRTIALDRAIDWIFSRCDAPGRFGDSCDAEMHELALCRHFLPSFFSPAPSAVDLSSMTLPGGAAIGSDRDARIAASCLACAAVVTWGEGGTHVNLHVDGAERILEHAMSGRAAISLPAILCATRLLCEVDASYVTRTAALEFVARSQRGDGSWRGADLFLVLDLLATATRMGVAPPAAGIALRHSANMLFLMQQPDGSWGRQTGPVQMLSGLSALRALHSGAPLTSDQRRPPQRTPTESSPPSML